MKKVWKQIVVSLLVAASTLSGCGAVGYEENKTYTYDEAVQELSSKLTKIDCSEVNAPLDIYMM